MKTTHAWFHWRCAPAFLLFLIAGFWPAPADAKNASKKLSPPDTLFASTNVLRIKIEIPEPGLAILRKYHWQFGSQSEREDVQVTVREGQNVFTNVALHLKGAAGSFRDIDQNPALTLHFDRYVPGQYFHGLGKLSLNNSVQDPTFVSEQLCRELFLAAGVPAPRATHAFVELNGRDLGLYVLIEGWDKQFLKRHFRKTGGNLYDGGFLKEVTDELTTNSGQTPKNQADRIALAQAAQEPNLTNRLARLDNVLDLDRFLTFIALDVMLWDWDGYAMNKNNWRLYHDLDKDRMVFMPHGMDQMFWKPDGSILPSMQGLVAKAALEIPALRTRYFDRMKSLRASVFNPEQMTNRVRQIQNTFKAVLEERYPAAAKEEEQAVDGFCHSIALRGRNLDEQLSHPLELPQFDRSGWVRLKGWESKADFGAPMLIRSSGPEHPATLLIGTDTGSSIGSWRTRLWLEKGRYRVEAKLKTDGIVPDPGDPRGGAGFRLGKLRPEKYVLGRTDWHLVNYEFSVDDPLGEVQIVCEFRGMEGKAWFDAESVRLERIQP
jgi:spore coat protein H